LQAYLRFEEDLEDSSGEGREVHAENGAGLAIDAPGWHSSALSLNGVDQWVSLGIDLQALPQATFSMWVRHERAPDASTGSMLFSNDDGDFDWGLNMTSDGTDWFWYAHLGSESGASYTETKAAALGEWHHVAIVYAADGVSIYQNGSVVWNLEGAPVAPSGTSYLALGRSNYQGFGDGHSYFHGYMDEFAVWNRALAPEEISQVAQQESCH
jgi:hypothetical protein